MHLVVSVDLNFSAFIPYKYEKLIHYILDEFDRTFYFSNRSEGSSAFTRKTRNEIMKVGLFIPCFIDAYFPEVGIATLELLERFDVEVVYPRNQTCCAQPMANSGFEADAAATEALFVRNFSEFEYIVGPSGSCVHQVRHHFTAIPQTADVGHIRAHTYELVEFLHDILKVEAFPWARFPHKVGLHNSCGTLRALGHASPSELHVPYFSKPQALLSKVEGARIRDTVPAR